MRSQKKLKTLGSDFQVYSEKNKSKASHYLFSHQPSEHQTKSISKEITPKKHSALMKKSNLKQIGSSFKHSSNNKQLNSVCSYSLLQKQTTPITKRKCSNTRSVIKNKIKSKIHTQIKNTKNNFSILTKCLSEFVKEQKKHGKNPSTQVLHFIKAFNRSQIGPVSKDLQQLIHSMLSCIEDTVQYDKVLSKSQSESEIQVQRNLRQQSQIQNKSYVPSFLGKNTRFKTEMKEISVRDLNSEFEKKEFQKIKKSQNVNNVQKKRSTKKADIQFENLLKKQVNEMKNQLQGLREAGMYLQNKTQSKSAQKQKLNDIYSKNKKTLQYLNGEDDYELSSNSSRREPEQEQNYE